MTVMKAWIRVAICGAILLAPATASADWFVFPFTAANSGGDTTRTSAALGGSVGWMGRWWGVEGEATASPSFFDDSDGFRSENRQSTYGGTALVGRRMGMWRPYGAAGIGWTRTHIEEIGGLARVEDDRAALNVGGGVMWEAMRRIGLRGDVRYIRALDDEEPVENVFSERLGEFSYWRIGGGVTIRW